jgi:hypothetical protein
LQDYYLLFFLSISQNYFSWERFFLKSFVTTYVLLYYYINFWKQPALSCRMEKSSFQIKKFCAVKSHQHAFERKKPNSLYNITCGINTTIIFMFSRVMYTMESKQKEAWEAINWFNVIEVFAFLIILLR